MVFHGLLQICKARAAACIGIGCAAKPCGAFIYAARARAVIMSHDSYITKTLNADLAQPRNRSIVARLSFVRGARDRLGTRLRDRLVVVAGSHDRNAAKSSEPGDEDGGVGRRSENTKTYVLFGGIDHEKSVKSVTKGVAP